MPGFSFLVILSLPHTYAHMYTCTYAQHICTYAHIHTCTYIHICTYATYWARIVRSQLRIRSNNWEFKIFLHVRDFTKIKNEKRLKKMKKGLFNSISLNPTIIANIWKMIKRVTNEKVNLELSWLPIRSISSHVLSVNKIYLQGVPKSSW